MHQVTFVGLCKHTLVIYEPLEEKNGKYVYNKEKFQVEMSDQEVKVQEVPVSEELLGRRVDEMQRTMFMNRSHLLPHGWMALDPELYSPAATGKKFAFVAGLVNRSFSRMGEILETWRNVDSVSRAAVIAAIGVILGQEAKDLEWISLVEDIEYTLLLTTNIEQLTGLERSCEMSIMQLYGFAQNFNAWADKEAFPHVPDVEDINALYHWNRTDPMYSSFNI